MKEGRRKKVVKRKDAKIQQERKSNDACWCIDRKKSRWIAEAKGNLNKTLEPIKITSASRQAVRITMILATSAVLLYIQPMHPNRTSISSTIP